MIECWSKQTYKLWWLIIHEKRNLNLFDWSYVRNKYKLWWLIVGGTYVKDLKNIGGVIYGSRYGDCSETHTDNKRLANVSFTQKRRYR